MRIGFANLMNIDMGMRIIFENKYGCGYSSIRPVPAPRSFQVAGRYDGFFSRSELRRRLHEHHRRLSLSSDA